MPIGESCNATDFQPDGETFSKEGPGTHLLIQPLLILNMYYQHYRMQLREGSPSHPPTRKRAVSTPESSPTLPPLGIFQGRFASKSHEELISETGAWSPPRRIWVSRTQVGVWASVPAAIISDDQLIRENERRSSHGMQRKSKGRLWMAFGGRQTQDSSYSSKDSWFYN